MKDDLISTPAADLSPTSLLNWLLGLLVGVIVFLWKLNESKNSKAIADLDARLIASDLRLVVSDKKHADCDADRSQLRVSFARLEERFNIIEKQSVHKSD